MDVKMSGLLQNETQEIAQQIQKLTKHNSMLKRMMGKIGTSSDTPSFRDKLEDERTGGQKLCKIIMMSLKDVQRQDSNSKTIHKLAAQFRTALTTYQGVSEEVERRSKAVVVTMSQNSRESPLTEAERQNMYQQEQDMKISMQFQAYDVEEVEKRQQAAVRIEQDVVEVAEMFKDLNILVNEQQDQLDTIDGLIGQAKDKTEGAEVELRKAEELQKKARKKKCCALFVLLAIAAGILIYLEVGKN